MQQMSNLESAIRDLVKANEMFWSCKNVPVERREQHDWENLRSWARMLVSTQEYLGIEVVDGEVVKANIEEAEKALAKG